MATKKLVVVLVTLLSRSGKPTLAGETGTGRPRRFRQKRTVENG
jgi:hypothetical protein